MTAELKLSIALFSSQIGLERIIELYCQGDKCEVVSVPINQEIKEWDKLANSQKQEEWDRRSGITSLTRSDISPNIYFLLSKLPICKGANTSDTDVSQTEVSFPSHFILFIKLISCHLSFMLSIQNVKRQNVTNISTLKKIHSGMVLL